MTVNSNGGSQLEDDEDQGRTARLSLIPNHLSTTGSHQHMHTAIAPSPPLSSCKPSRLGRNSNPRVCAASRDRIGHTWRCTHDPISFARFLSVPSPRPLPFLLEGCPARLTPDCRLGETSWQMLIFALSILNAGGQLQSPSLPPNTCARHGTEGKEEAYGYRARDGMCVKLSLHLRASPGPVHHQQPHPMKTTNSTSPDRQGTSS
ncbi:hypothetical protein QBC39DRAFT_364140 [Podospora conica]|nr:hypothetical protein QBC39DRAFT_364140 [Schizothecium conicum]